MYTYHYGGRDGIAQRLVEANDLVVVRTREVENLKELSLSQRGADLLPDLLPVLRFPEANVTVFKVLPPEYSTAIRHRNRIRKQLPQEEGVRFAGRVLRDPKTGTIKIYTENFFVQFSASLTEKECEAITARLGLISKERLGFAENAFFLAAPEGTGTEIFAIAEALLQRPEVLLCHPELVQERRHKSIFPMQWHLKASRINNEWIEEHIQVEDAWAYSRGAGITIAVIDDGVDVEHEEFKGQGKVVYPRDTIINRNDGRPKFSMEVHGTACAGVACASGKYMASGVAPEAKLMPIRSGGLGSMSEAKAFQWAADNGADVISCSWGPRDGAWFNPADPLHTEIFYLPDSARLAINYATETGRQGKGCVITWAAGNGNENTKYDGYASYDRVIAVAACNDRGKRSVYSDYGKAVWCAFPSSDFGHAPYHHPPARTAGIWTTDRSGQEGYNLGGRDDPERTGDQEGKYTATFGGTSSSCPGVAGVVALMFGVNPNLTWYDIKQMIKNACEKIDIEDGRYDARGHSLFYGFGRINALKAVRATEKTLGPVDHFDIWGIAAFSRNSYVGLAEGKFTFDDFDNNRFVGLALETDPMHPDLKLEYQVVVNRWGSSGWVSSGHWAETPDRRRKIIGFAVRLKGKLANQYTVQYSAKLRGLNKAVSARDGAICGTDAERGKAIQEIKIEIKNR
ncbi:MAG TPA: S8 family serine peptidase [Saprospiraceae bacterium]|nr:S8 family serine peptidase [Saprospiraceae bacterium]